MPLLNKKPLSLVGTDEVFGDDEEVFHCVHTNEIFRNYEDYCQRIISCNSLIWSCAMTGKSNLTYQEALASEEAALKSVKDFPKELRIPLLYLASKTNRSNFNELAEDVFNFARDKFFKGECVEASVGDEDWPFALIISVIPPTESEIEKFYKENVHLSKPPSGQPFNGSLYCYQIEKLDDDDDDDDDDSDSDCDAEYECKVVNGSCLKRRKGVYSREKNRIFLKQFAEVKKFSKWGIQENILLKYSISTLKFCQIFTGNPPNFDLVKKVVNVDKVTQQSLMKYLVPKSSNEKHKKSFQPSKATEHFKKIYQKKMEEKSRGATEIAGKVLKRYQNSINKVAILGKKEALKQQILEERARRLDELKQKKEQKRADKQKLADFVKQWQRQREDLECEDLKDLPVPVPIQCRVPNEYFGDLVMILEFFHSFSAVLKVKDFFPSGLKFEILERALIDVEIAGPFSDILQLLLVSVFFLQEQEDDEIQNTRSYQSTDIQGDEVGDLTVAEAVKLATAAANWSLVHHGTPLKDLSLDVYTLTEILRLHLLSSGGRAGDASAKWRWQERGGYTSTDDPGLMLRLNDPHILRCLSLKSVCELSVGDKVKILSCLMNQILTYAEIRDVIDERCEKVRLGKIEIKKQAAEAKKEIKTIAEKNKKLEEAKEKGEAVVEETEEQKLKSEKESQKKKTELSNRIRDVQEVAMGYHVLPLGQDRAHRRFWIFSSLPGLYVEDDERWAGSCLPQPTPINRVISQEEDTMSYVQKLFAGEKNGSDKENKCDTSHQPCTPKKKFLTDANSGNENSLLESPSNLKTLKEEDTKVSQFLICTGKQETCSIHGVVKDKVKWHFYYLESDIQNLISKLNKRGYREHHLRQVLLEEKGRILSTLQKCPVYKLNQFIPNISEPLALSRGRKGYENSNFKFPLGTPIDRIFELQLRDIILDTEDKLYAGFLGSIKVKSREAWRAAIENEDYDKQCDGLSWGGNETRKDTNKTIEKLKQEVNEVSSRPDTPCSMDSSHEVDISCSKQEQNPTVKNLASAILQMAQAVEPKYLQKPLPYEEKGGESKKLTRMERWESSLMLSTSFSQLYLHFATLENSIRWEKSALKARCKICRRGGDPENMLLCDGCDRGYHLYCLKPKLSCIPKGDWFCLVCRPKERKEENVRKVRKLFSEESDEDCDATVSRSGRRCKKTNFNEDSNGKKSRQSDADYEPYKTVTKKKKKVLNFSSESKKVKEDLKSTKRSSRRLDSDDVPLSKVTNEEVSKKRQRRSVGDSSL